MPKISQPISARRLRRSKNFGDVNKRVINMQVSSKFRYTRDGLLDFRNRDVNNDLVLDRQSGQGG